jgi:hypothetical protein
VAQTVEYVEVPQGWKVVLVPWYVPAEDLEWVLTPAKEVIKEEEECDKLVFGGLPIECDSD